MRATRFIAGAATLVLSCGALVGAAATRAAADDVPTLSVADVTAREGDSGTAAIRVPVTLSAPYMASKIKVPYQVVEAPDNTPGAPPTAKIFRGTVTFLPGVVSKYVTVASYGDETPEPDQHVEVVLGTPIGGNVAIEKGVG